MTCIESNHFPPKSGISEGPGLASSDSKQDIRQFYEAVMENLSFKGKDKIYSHLKAMKEDSQSVYSFVARIFDMLGEMADMRADPILKSISSLTLSIINEEKLKCEDDDEVDFHSDDEDDKCIELSMNSSENEDSPAIYPPPHSFKTNKPDFKIRSRKIEFSKQSSNTYLNTVSNLLEAESSDSESEETLHEPEGQQTPRTISTVSNFEDLKTVEERTVESEDEKKYKKGSNSPVKIKYSSNINFDQLSNNKVKDVSEDRFLRIKHLQRNYIVHYINKPDTDFRLSLEFLKNSKTLSIDIETTNKQTVSYIQFACRKKCYVFNVFQLGQNEDLLDFLIEIFQDSRVLKVIFDKVEFLPWIESLVGDDRRLKFQSLFAVKQRLFTSDPANSDLSSCCLRLFNKKPDTIFRTWVSNTRELGLDEIHYLALNALVTYMIYVKIKSDLLISESSDLGLNLQITDIGLKDKQFIVDYSCPEIVSDILELNQFKFRVMKKGSYKEILKDAENQEDWILITNDKYFLMKHTFMHYITYFSPKQLKEYLNHLVQCFKTSKIQKIM